MNEKVIDPEREAMSDNQLARAVARTLEIVSTTEIVGSAFILGRGAEIRIEGDLTSTWFIESKRRFPPEGDTSPWVRDSEDFPATKKVVLYECVRESLYRVNLDQNTAGPRVFRSAFTSP